MRVVPGKAYREIPERHAKEYCVPRNGAWTCRYLLNREGLWTCSKLDKAEKRKVDAILQEKKILAAGDNCDGIKMITTL
jgi:hypothetical protein